jgi:hypothetical protein
MEVYERGKNLGSFNYMDDSDFDDSYMGYFIEYNNMVYQIIVTRHNVIVNPESQAIPFAPSLDYARNQIVKKSEEPISVETRIVDKNYFDNASEFHKIDYDLVAEKMENMLDSDTTFSEFFNIETDEIPTNINHKNLDVNNNSINFDRPW